MFATITRAPSCVLSWKSPWFSSPQFLSLDSTLICISAFEQSPPALLSDLELRPKDSGWPQVSGTTSWLPWEFHLLNTGWEPTPVQDSNLWVTRMPCLPKSSNEPQLYELDFMHIPEEQHDGWNTELPKTLVRMENMEEYFHPGSI